MIYNIHLRYIDAKYHFRIVEENSQNCSILKVLTSLKRDVHFDIQAISKWTSRLTDGHCMDITQYYVFNKK